MEFLMFWRKKKQPNEIHRTIEELSPLGRWLFGLSICERLYPNYVAFQDLTGWGDAARLRAALDDAWTMVQTGSLDQERIAQHLELCEPIIPDTEDFTTTLVSAALRASCVVCSLLESMQFNSVEKTVEIATLATDTVDMHIQFTKPDGPYLLGKKEREELQRFIDGHWLMRREIDRQKNTLAQLKQAPELNEQVVREFEQEARAYGSNIDLQAAIG